MKGWLVITATVIGYDLWAATTRNPTLSTIFRERSRRHPIISGICCTYMLAHLHGVIPLQYDPLRRIDVRPLRRIELPARSESNRQPLA